MRYAARIDEKHRQLAVRRVLLLTLVLNLAVAVAKGVYAAVSGSLAIAADAVHSVVDAVANIAGLILLARASEPPDDEHPYGHRKLEVIAAAAIGVFVGTAAVRFGWSAIDALISGHEPPATSTAGFAVIGATWGINAFVALWEARRARELDSPYLAADAAHTASDVAVTTAVMAAFSAAHLGVAWADPIGALLVIAIIGKVAWGILATNLSVLLDTAVLPAERVIEIARAVPGVRGCHRVRSRGSRSAALVDLHVLLDNELTLREAHAIAHSVEQALRGAFSGIVDVTVHTEPEEDGFEEL